MKIVLSISWGYVDWERRNASSPIGATISLEHTTDATGYTGDLTLSRQLVDTLHAAAGTW
jgi:hypothetical protein